MLRQQRARLELAAFNDPPLLRLALPAALPPPRGP